MSGAAEPSERDLAKWRRLAKHARRCAENPALYVGDLATVMKGHREVPMPPPVSKESPFNQLFRLSKTFVAAKAADRPAMAADMKRLADEVDARLSTPVQPQAQPSEASPPAWQERADIGG
jgi:hypothetical protein